VRSVVTHSAEPSVTCVDRQAGTLAGRQHAGNRARIHACDFGCTAVGSMLFQVCGLNMAGSLSCQKYMQYCMR
jgi:hypothetical protein